MPLDRPIVKKEQPGKKAWCACGHSENQPYCDGSHARFPGSPMPIRVDIEHEMTVAWCGCKKTAKPPYCDGSHAASS